METEKITEILRGCGTPDFGFTPFDPDHLLRCAAARRLPKEPRTVIVAIFPYFTGRHREANLSQYAMVPDYHRVVGELLEHAARTLENEFPGHFFVPFCDNSPIPEVEAARRAGLGCVGDHGLLIHPAFGSYVFIGEIVTDLTVADPKREPGGGCLHCGACAVACPAGVLGTCRAMAGCLSAVTQKKGELTDCERRLIRGGGSVWGCDRCQDVCPMNHNVRPTDFPPFCINLKSRLELEEIDENFAKDHPDRAFLWRGVEVLRRNLRIIGNAPEDTNP